MFLTDLLEEKASETPDQIALTLLNPGQQEIDVTLAQLGRDMRAAAGAMPGQGIRSGEVILLAFDHGYPLLSTYLGAIYLGAVPAILPYFSVFRTAGAYRKYAGILLLESGASTIVSQNDPPWPLADVFQDDETRVVPLFTAGEILERPGGSEGLSHIQFSSGTTGTPKGVINEREQVMAYLESTGAGHQITPEDVVVGWLPFYHDMGLVTQLLQPLYSGYRSVIINPAHWLGQPAILFEAIHRYQGTMTWMPNFAFKYCVRRVDAGDLEGGSLASLRIVGCGSEPVQIEAIERFAGYFKGLGLRKEAIAVSYGMAEHVAGITFSPLNEFPRVDWIEEAALQSSSEPPGSLTAGESATRPVVSCGIPKSGVKLRIVDENGSAVADRLVGEVWLKSPYLFPGYHNRPDETGAVFHNGWFMSGDLGYLSEGQLYICGRKKDLIISGGRNISPLTVEQAAQETLGKACRFAVAFGVYDPALGTESVVLVCEMRHMPAADRRDEVERAIRREVNSQANVLVQNIELVQSHWIVRTTSGKLNRAANREKYLSEFGLADAPRQKDQSEDVSEPDQLPIRESLAGIWKALLNVQQLQPVDDFFDLGGDSLTVIRLLMEVEKQFGRRLTSRQLLENSTLEALARFISSPGEETGWQSIVPICPKIAENVRPIFFCVHGLGGGVLGYRPLSTALGPEQPFYALQARGLNGGPIDRRIEDMAGAYVKEVSRIQPEGPYHLGGYIFGGVVAYEMACQLQEAGLEIGLVAVIDGYLSSGRGDQNRLRHELRYAVNFLRNMPFWFKDYVRLSRLRAGGNRRRLWRAFSRRFASIVDREPLSKKANLDVSAEGLPARHQRLMESHIRAMRDYQPRPFEGEIKLLRTRQIILRSPEHDMGWGRVTSVDTHRIGGSHGSVLEPPHVKELAARLVELLGRAE